MCGFYLRRLPASFTISGTLSRLVIELKAPGSE